MQRAEEQLRNMERERALRFPEKLRERCMNGWSRLRRIEALPFSSSVPSTQVGLALVTDHLHLQPRANHASGTGHCYCAYF